MRGKANALHNLGFVAMGQCDYRAALSLSERSLALARQVGEKHHITLTVTNIGVAATKLGELVQARERFRESLQLARELVARRAGAAAIEGAGELASALGRCRGSVRFYGAATALREEIGAPLDPKDAKEEGALVSDLRCRLGEITFESEWAAGRGLSFEAAVGEALAWLESNDWMAAETNA